MESEMDQMVCFYLIDNFQWWESNRGLSSTKGCTNSELSVLLPKRMARKKITIYSTGIFTIFWPHLWFELRIIDPTYQIVSIELIDYGKEKLNHWETFYTINPPLPLVLLLLSCYYLLRVHQRHLWSGQGIHGPPGPGTDRFMDGDLLMSKNTFARISRHFELTKKSEF